ncbi:MAG: hypothetical protein M0Z66_07550 [Thermaerobacter sp.]|nr:hypothetical protein [Thermaerobacter sp.]
MRDMTAQIEWRDGTLSTEDARNLLGLLETEPEQMWRRIARAVAAVETTAGREEWEPRFRSILHDFKYVPGGRILAGAGVEANLTFSNCFVIPSPHDSRGGIVDTLKAQAEIMARGGGVGFDISTLRPQGAPVLGVNGTSSGPVDFANLYSTMTGIIEQAGSRRGALMQTIHDWHPDLLRFISAKSEDERFINHANLSVLVSDRFMLAVREDLEWAFVFPDTSAPGYNKRWDGDIDAWIASGGPVVEYGRMPARKVWRAIAEYAHRRGEPGVIFIDAVLRESTTNATYRGRRKEVSTNPCVTGDTLIFTDDGAIRAEEMAESGLPVNVLGMDGRMHAASKVFATGVKSVVRLTFADGRHLRLTPDHLVLTTQGWIAAEDLTPQHEIATAAGTTRLVSREDDGIETVYDLTEPVTHSFVANGIVVHNCGEQPLPPFGNCNLGAINLAAFAKNGKVDLRALAETTAVAVRFQDDVIDAGYYPLPEIEHWAKQERRIGLGIMGLADMFIMLGVRYGSEEARRITENVFRTIRDAAYSASCDLALEKGPFPAFDRDGYMQAGFVARLPGEIQKRIHESGIRNITLLTVAPTGTTSLLAGVSSGIEPVFRFRTLRKDALGEHVILHPLAEAWQGEHPGESLPDCFVSAEQLTPEEHVTMQATAQAYIDASISKTINGPNSHTVEDVERIFTLAYGSGCKGVTYFRDGSVNEVVLKEAAAAEEPPSKDDSFVELAPRPDRMLGRAYRVKTHFGTLTLDVHEVEPGGASTGGSSPFEIFVNVGAVGSDLMADAVALGRLASTMLRMDSRIVPARRLDIIIDKLRGIGGSGSYGFGPQRVTSLASAIAKGLQMYLNDIRGKEDDPIEPPDPPEQAGEADLCPECGSYALVKEEGCRTCHACGFSLC